MCKNEEDKKWGGKKIIGLTEDWFCVKLKPRFECTDRLYLLLTVSCSSFIPFTKLPRGGAIDLEGQRKGENSSEFFPFFVGNMGFFVWFSENPEEKKRDNLWLEYHGICRHFWTTWNDLHRNLSPLKFSSTYSSRATEAKDKSIQQRVIFLVFPQQT